MSFPTPVLGFTIRNLVSDITEAEIARFGTLVAEHEDDLRANLDQIDPAGMIDFNPEYELVDELIGGYANLVRYHSDSGWDIPNTDGHQFIIISQGAGVDEASEFDQLSLLINACTVVPAFGRALGILGDGIRVH